MSQSGFEGTIMKPKFAIAAALAGATILGAVAVSFGAAQSGKDRLSAGDKEQIEEIVRDYIAENPEAIIDALNAYAANEQVRAEEEMRVSALDNLPALLASNHGFAAGADVENASVAVIEFFDYHCSFCKTASGLVLDLTKGDKDVKVVFRELPIIRQESEYPAKVALAAREQGQYVKLHFMLMNAKGVLTESRVNEMAEQAGLDLARIKSAIKSKDVVDSLRETKQIARDMGIDGTPMFVIASLDGDFLEMISGYRPDEIAAAIKEAKK